MERVVNVENKIIIPVEAKKKYLEKLIGKMIKILHLIEEEKDTGCDPSKDVDPLNFIYGQLVELNSANQLFDNELIEVIVKLNIIYCGYNEMEFKDIKKQIFEIKSKINYLLKNINE